MSSLQHFPVKLEGFSFSMFFLGWFFVTFSCPVQKLVLGFILCKTLTPKLLNLKVSNQKNTVSRTVVFFVASKKSFRPPRYVPSPDLYCDFSHVEIHHLPRGGGNFGFQLEVVDG